MWRIVAEGVGSARIKQENGRGTAEHLKPLTKGCVNCTAAAKTTPKCANVKNCRKLQQQSSYARTTPNSFASTRGGGIQSVLIASALLHGAFRPLQVVKVGRRFPAITVVLPKNPLTADRGMSMTSGTLSCRSPIKWFSLVLGAQTFLLVESSGPCRSVKPFETVNDDGSEVPPNSSSIKHALGYLFRVHRNPSRVWLSGEAWVSIPGFILVIPIPVPKRVPS